MKKCHNLKYLTISISDEYYEGEMWAEQSYMFFKVPLQLKRWIFLKVLDIYFYT